MTWYQIDLLYDVCFGATVCVEAPDVDDACHRAIEEAGELEAWKSRDHASDPYIREILEVDRPEPPYSACTALPIPDPYTRDGPPPMVTVSADSPPGSIAISGGTVRLRLIHSSFAIARDISDPPSPPGNKPVVTVARRPDGTPDITVANGDAHVRVTGWDGPAHSPSTR